jgi:hypothetical protein
MAAPEYKRNAADPTSSGRLDDFFRLDMLMTILLGVGTMFASEGVKIYVYTCIYE